jgi:hypothetical protein
VTKLICVQQAEIVRDLPSASAQPQWELFSPVCAVGLLNRTHVMPRDVEAFFENCGGGRRFPGSLGIDECQP